MGYLDCLEFYLNLSRKELQGLCKKYNLPANRSQIQLAKSLASCYEKKNANTKSSKERPISSLGALFSSSPFLESKPKETVHPQEGTTKDILGPFERRTYHPNFDSPRLASSKEIQVDDRPYSQPGNWRASKKAYDTPLQTGCPCPVNVEPTQGFGSTPEVGVVGNNPSVADDIQEGTTILKLGPECHEDIYETNNEPNNSIKFSSRQQKNIACSTEGIFIAPDEISTKSVPSFQFFVSSEEGINLCIDLSSSMTERINNMKDNMNIHQKAQDPKSSTTSKHINVDEPLKVSSFRMDLPNDGAERNTGCTNSSLSSDGAILTSVSSVLTSSSNPVESSGCYEENPVASTSCRNGEERMRPQHSIDASFMVEKNIAPALDVPLKSAGNIDLLTPAGTKSIDPSCRPLEINTVDSSNIEDGTFCQVPVKRGTSEGKPEVAGDVILDYQATIGHSNASLAHSILEQHDCCCLGKAVTDGTTDFNDESGKGVAVKDKEIPECFELQNCSDKKFQRSYGLEFIENSPTKKQHANAERTTKTWTKDAISNTVVLPRRSTRLVSK